MTTSSDELTADDAREVLRRCIDAGERAQLIPSYETLVVLAAEIERLTRERDEARKPGLFEKPTDKNYKELLAAANRENGALFRAEAAEARLAALSVPVEDEEVNLLCHQLVAAANSVGGNEEDTIMCAVDVICRLASSLARVREDCATVCDHIAINAERRAACHENEAAKTAAIDKMEAAQLCALEIRALATLNQPEKADDNTDAR